MGDATIPLGTVHGRILPLARPDRRRFGARFGNYELIAPLASGGMGGVYLAAHVETGDRVALKVLDPRFADHAEVVRRLFGEHAVSQRAQHPGLVDIRAAARNLDDIPYLVMEYLEGETLADIAFELEPLALTAVITWGAQAAAAIAALHAVGVVHCDVKPENMLVLRSGAVKVLDFGVSRFVDEPPPDDHGIAGTPAYMAPEQWRGEPGVACDVYALGCTLFELITGDVPFAGSLPELMISHAEARPARLSWLRSGVSAALERLVLRTLAKEAELRPTMLDVAAELEQLAAADLPLRMAG